MLSHDLVEGPKSNKYKFIEIKHSQQLLLTLNNLRRREKFCDVTISVDGEKFPAHRNVLAGFSPYFEAMFLSDFIEFHQNEVTLIGVEPEIISLLLEYAYTSKLMITRSNVQGVLSAADLLQVLSIKEAACQFLENHIDAGNCLSIHCLAELHSCSKLQEKTKNYILENFNEVYKQEEFLNLTTCKLMELIASDDLQVEKEEFVFQSLLTWYQHNPEQRKYDFPKLFENVRLTLLSPSFLVYCESNPIVIDNPECLKLIDDAKKYNLLPDNRHELTLRNKARLNSDTVIITVRSKGYKNYAFLAVECYCIISKTWKSLTCFPYALSKYSLVASDRYTFYLAGGKFLDGGPSRCVWKYNFEFDYWQEIEPMLVARSEFGLAMLDGFLYAIGGWEGTNTLNSVERYDPSTNTWSFIEPMIRPISPVSVAAHEGLLYVTGGVLWSVDEGEGAVQFLQRYDSISNTWTIVSHMNIPRSGAALCALDNYIYVIGGYNAFRQITNWVERYNIEKGIWEYRSLMCKKRSRPGVSVINGQIYILGGEGRYLSFHDSIEIYNPKTDQWTLSGKMLKGHRLFSCAPLQTSKLKRCNQCNEPLICREFSNHCVLYVLQKYKIIHCSSCTVRKASLLFYETSLFLIKSIFSDLLIV